MDVIIDAVGSKESRRTAIQSAKPGSVIVHVGLLDGVDGFDARRLTLQEITFVGVYTYTMMDFQQTVTAMAEGKLGALDWLKNVHYWRDPMRFQIFCKGKPPQRR